VLLVIGVLFLAAATAQAGLSRPDLLQVSDDYFTDSDQPSGVDDAWAWLHMFSSQVSGSVGISATSGDTSAGFTGAIGDFDKATKTSKLATLINRKNTYMTAWTHTIDSDDSVAENVRLEDCSLRIAAKDEDDDGSADSAKWKLDCKSDALSRIGLSEGAQLRLLEIFESADANRTDAEALSYHGKGPLD
jgi:hypothetical protein